MPISGSAALLGSLTYQASYPQTIKPPILRQANGLQDRGRPMRVNDVLRMEYDA